MMKTLRDGETEGGEPAQTGSLAHVGIAKFHMTDSLIEAVTALQERKTDYPLADAGKAETLARNYCRRIQEKPARGKVVGVEERYEIEIECSEVDTTKEKIVITGHVDLVYDCGDYMEVIDHKSGWPTGEQMVQAYQLQLAAYCHAVAARFGKRTVPYITRLLDAGMRAKPLYWYMGFDSTHTNDILQVVRDRIADIRAGRLHKTPGKHCEYCPLQYPTCITGEKKPEPKKLVPLFGGIK